MPTDKPRVTITMSSDQFEKVDNYRFSHKMKNQTQAILTLIEYGLSSIEKAPSDIDGDVPSRLKTLIDSYNQLNDEGQLKLVDLADDLVSSGKYIKTDPARLGKMA